TDNRVPGVKTTEMVEPDVVTYESYDGMEIKALLFKAKPEHDNGHTIFLPHGGPQAAERKILSNRIGAEGRALTVSPESNGCWHKALLTGKSYFSSAAATADIWRCFCMGATPNTSRLSSYFWPV